MKTQHVLNRFMATVFTLALPVLILTSSLNALEANAAAKTFQKISPLELVKTPDSWVGQSVAFEGVFNNFDAYALDYKPAYRDPKDFVCVIIRRPDTPAHPIPLSELKMVFPRSKSKSVRDLEPGDKIALQGKVFSSALGDPWLELSDVKILEKTPNSKLKDKDKKAAH